MTICVGFAAMTIVTGVIVSVAITVDALEVVPVATPTTSVQVAVPVLMVHEAATLTI